MTRGSDYCGRFAPSPSGALHPGSLAVALGSWLRARQAGGRWLVRIEDLDPPREVPGAARAILDALLAFGLTADGAVLFQSARSAAYAAALDALIAGNLAFACWCTRSDLAPSGVHRACIRGPDPRRAPSWRLRVAAPLEGFTDLRRGLIAPPRLEQAGDFVLKRHDGLWSYVLAVVVDDAAQGVTEIVRGADLIDSTWQQVLLQRCLHLPTPTFLHLPLLTDAQGRKLSKSLHSPAVDPAQPAAALRAVFPALGLGPAPISDDLAQLLRFALDTFSIAKLALGPIDMHSSNHDSTAAG